MDVLIEILCCAVVLSVLVFIHEGGHFLAAKAFGIRVTEFMIGLPGPSIGFTHNGTKFGITPILLGGYARVCGMEAGNLKPFLPEVLQFMHTRGSATASQVAYFCRITLDQAEDALDELITWGDVCDSRKGEPQDMYYAAELDGYKRGEPREVTDKMAYFQAEYDKQYRSLSFWKRSVVLLAGVSVNLLFAILVFLLLFTLIGVDVANQSGDIVHVVLNPLQAIQFGFAYVWAVIQALFGLFNPATAADTVQNSTSLIGIAVYSKAAAEEGIWTFLQFMAMISVSLGIVNLIPIPPLDGGRFIVEIVQAVTRRNVPERILNAITWIGIILFIAFFVFMLNQDVQRFILGG